MPPDKHNFRQSIIPVVSGACLDFLVPSWSISSRIGVRTYYGESHGMSTRKWYTAFLLSTEGCKFDYCLQVTECKALSKAITFGARPAISVHHPFVCRCQLLFLPEQLSLPCKSCPQIHQQPSPPLHPSTQIINVLEQ